jgi:hypothetical protein
MRTAVFDDILNTLKDGKYHTFEELQFAVGAKLDDEQIEVVLAFLEKYDFVSRMRKPWSTLTRKVALKPVLFEFLKKLKALNIVEKEVEATVEATQNE